MYIYIYVYVYKCVNKQDVQTETLDGLLRRLCLKPADYNFLYLDVQGSELDVLQGSTRLVLPQRLGDTSPSEAWENRDGFGGIWRHVKPSWRAKHGEQS